ncbi:MAG TPA: YfhO family protein, partial [Bryobacteraceae bacterium]|nr:YfhO family protein [Bryobacteraceae bacterium]
AADLEPASQGAAEDVTFRAYEADRMVMDVHASGRGLVVLSEVFYPGWHARVNGSPARIYKVDGALRGIVVPGGDRRVVLEYAPASVLAGGILTALAFCAGIVVVGLGWRGKSLATNGHE